MTIKHGSPQDHFTVKQQYFIHDCDRGLPMSLQWSFFSCTTYSISVCLGNEFPLCPRSTWPQTVGRNPLAIASDWLFAQLWDTQRLAPPTRPTGHVAWDISDTACSNVSDTKYTSGQEVNLTSNFKCVFLKCYRTCIWCSPLDLQKRFEGKPFWNETFQPFLQLSSGTFLNFHARMLIVLLLITCDRQDSQADAPIM